MNQELAVSLFQNIFDRQIKCLMFKFILNFLKGCFFFQIFTHCVFKIILCVALYASLIWLQARGKRYDIIILYPQPIV